MKIKSKRFLTVFLTLIFTVTVFTLTAFAESNTSATVDPPTQQTAEPVPENSGNPSKPDGETSQTEETSKPGNETSQTESVTSEHSSETSQTRTSSNDTQSSSKKPVSSRQPTHSVDTHAREVEAAASRVAQTVSDPNVLSSQDWGELLSSGQSTVSDTQAAAGAVSSETNTPSGIGGVSWLLILGVVLIVLALCGIGLFIYLQFFLKSGKGLKNGRTTSAAAFGKNSDEEPLTFVDISSDSSGVQNRGDSISDGTQAFTDISSSSQTPPVKTKPAVKPLATAPVKQAAMPKTAVKPAVSDTEETAPIPQEALPHRKPSAPNPGSEPLPKSQAKPVNQSNFDWEKFFNDEK